MFKDGENGSWIVPPSMMGMMTGCASAFHIGDRWQLRYTDGTTEEAICQVPEDANFLEMVGTVQQASRASVKR